MIAVSALLVLVAIVALAVGFTGSTLDPGLATTGMILVYVSIGLCVVAGVLLIAGYVRGRRTATKRRPGRSGRTSGSKARGGAPRSGGGGGRKPDSRKKAPTRKAAKAGGRAAAASGAVGVLDGDVPDGAGVVVVPGRLRYHLANCRQVSGRDTEEVTVSQARDQGYVACTACRPDAVLAARAEGGPENAKVTSADATESDVDDAADERDDATRVLVVSGHRRYHVEACQVVADAREDGTDVAEESVADAKDRGLTPCRVCGAPAADDA
ncbi:MAG: hypothetical protein J2P14_13055 [Acidothermales bacterium]|nr:hypothetical protein [Acidothermales bacterium]